MINVAVIEAILRLKDELTPALASAGERVQESVLPRSIELMRAIGLTLPLRPISSCT